MNEKALHTLEYHKIIRALCEEATSLPGKERCGALLPLKSLEAINRAQQETADAFSRLVKNGAISFSGLVPIEDICRRLSLGASLNAPELLRVASLLDTAAQAVSYAGENEEDVPPDSLSPLFALLAPVSTLSREIHRCILSENEISDTASPALKSIRRKLSAMNDRIHEALGKIVNSSARAHLTDPVITLRNGRFCLPVRADCKALVPGMVHGQSASGSTLFIEPMSVVNLNNEQKELAAQEQEEIERILAALSQNAAAYQTEMQQDYEALLALDVIFAKGRLALSQNASRPEFNEDGVVRIRQGRHPLLDPQKVVPIDIGLGEDFSLLVITGPNTGGKTVSLKTVGLFTLMGEAGLFIPAAERSRLSLFHEVYADIGDEQSIEQSLSTFSAHMTNIADILRRADEHALILFDELGAGTDPVEGAALAVSILAYLKEKHIRAIATTHYSELKVYALQTEGVKNASCEFNVQTLRPTYRILVGVPGKSNAFAISERLGVPKALIEDARRRVSEQDVAFEDLLTRLEEDRLLAEKRQAVLKEEEARLQAARAALLCEQAAAAESRAALLEEARSEAERVLREAKRFADESLRSLRKLRKEGGVSASMEREREALRQKLKSSQAAREEEKKTPHKQHKVSDFSVGDAVYVHSMHVKGTVLSLPDAKGTLAVQMGIIRSRVPYTDLEILPEKAPAEGVAKRTPGAGQAAGLGMGKSLAVSREINLLGLTVDEGVAALEKYLDDAALAHLTSVRVIHGKGTGKLREGIHAYLRKRAKHAKGFHLAALGEGDAGVTIVDIK